MMIKTLLLGAFIASASVAAAQTANVNQPSQVATESKTLTFKSQQDKDARIKKTEDLIELRLSQGKTKQDLTNHYKELERIKAAKIVAVSQKNDE